jgi:hypothetical protein
VLTKAFADRLMQVAQKKSFPFSVCQGVIKEGFSLLEPMFSMGNTARVGLHSGNDRNGGPWQTFMFTGKNVF